MDNICTFPELITSPTVTTGETLSYVNSPRCDLIYFATNVREVDGAISSADK